MSTPTSTARRRPPPTTSSSTSPSVICLLLTASPTWLPLLLLIFGGCCSNAVFLELSTRQAPSLGTLITLLQFFFTMLLALPAQLERTNTGKGGGGVMGWKLKKRAVPMGRWAVQVVLYATTSLLNNVAFAYEVPMTVHIIFRSGGLVVNMVMGWAIRGRRYSALQIAAVILVTGGVILSTLSTQPAPSTAPTTSSTSSTTPALSNYLTGISLLSLALFLSSLMGLWQEATFHSYGNPDVWKEALFYSHALSLPLVGLGRWGEVRREVETVLGSPRVTVQLFGLGMGSKVPSLVPLLALNVLTQLACINGVNRLTARVSSVAVTLVLVVRKAASLAISVLLLNRGRPGAQQGNMGLLVGAVGVFAGTVAYAWGSSGGGKKGEEVKEKQLRRGEEGEEWLVSQQDGKAAPAAGSATAVDGAAAATAATRRRGHGDGQAPPPPAA